MMAYHLLTGWIDFMPWRVRGFDAALSSLHGFQLRYAIV
jgi:hypothetical protein